MLPADIKVGHILRYSYLWHWQHLEGREEGDKDRHCLVLALVATLEDGTPVVRVLPITHTLQINAEDALEIPAAVKNRLRVDKERSWIILTESNRFAWPGPDLRPLDSADGYFGPLPPALFNQVKSRFVESARAGAAQACDGCGHRSRQRRDRHCELKRHPDAGCQCGKLVLTGAAAINGTVNALANIITGNAANNVLNGGAGVDTMIGGLGNDTYYIDVAGESLPKRPARAPIVSIPALTIRWRLMSKTSS